MGFVASRSLRKASLAPGCSCFRRRFLRRKKMHAAMPQQHSINPQTLAMAARADTERPPSKVLAESVSDPVDRGGRQPPVTLLTPYRHVDADAVPVAEGVAVCEATCDPLEDGDAPRERLCVAVPDVDGVDNDEPVGEGVGRAEGDGEQAVFMARSRTPRKTLEATHGPPSELTTELSACPTPSTGGAPFPTDTHCSDAFAAAKATVKLRPEFESAMNDAGRAIVE